MSKCNVSNQTEAFLPTHLLLLLDDGLLLHHLFGLLGLLCLNGGSLRRGAELVRRLDLSQTEQNNGCEYLRQFIKQNENVQYVFRNREDTIILPAYNQTHIVHRPKNAQRQSGDETQLCLVFGGLTAYASQHFVGYFLTVRTSIVRSGGTRVSDRWCKRRGDWRYVL